ncbi:G-type lectin S-receptor-like serine/threonine-protein kinase RKS1 [Cinnamomum micranthum f. kanehirae]|uniref:G-type lectin S-receptor-like serine/threonine-protein kinase RKS1 n=1 Tax=Cinnamomum micranthum f. kanehirae TaxID=337451 RepID=A0A3S3N939_9MAGN|nr:G-type lectin S-receptor-like serine/threonine-protein kinase RKS1 [Cinnamomum micranthum f. kanehirae]
MAYHQNFVSLLIAVLIFFPLCNSKDTITPIQSVRDGETLVSAYENFVLGFFSPGKSKNRYIGIWLNKSPNQTVVWVANRENPVSDSSGILTINGGNLVLVGDGGYNSNTTTILWSTNVSIVPKLSTATLMDSGNLILRDDLQRILWESFDHPTNTFLPKMKLGLDRRTGLNRFLTSWRSIEDPASGEFSFGIDPHGMPQLLIRKGSDPIWRETWNGQRLISMRANNPISGYTYVSNDEEIYFMYTNNDSSIMTIAILNVLGVFQRLLWTSKKPQWDVIWAAPQDRCDLYANCGAYGSCDSNRVAECSCIKGFEPKMPRDWNLREWSAGCMRRRTLDCAGKGGGFLKLELVKLPDTSGSRLEPTLNLNECKEECLKNCSCAAYASANISEEGSGCVIWYGNLTDVKVYSDQGQDLYTRVAAPELAALIFFPLCSSKDTITPIQSVRDGETLVSAGKNFALGFFSPVNSKNRYIGIWFNNIPNKTVVWVANRENPVRDSSGILTINAGNLELVGDGEYNSNTTSILWSTNVSNLVPKLSNATLMDSGNLILRDDHHNILWQSFDHPTNTLLPNMKLRLDRRSGLNRFLTSWRSIEDPAPGEFSFGLDPHGMPQFSVRKGSDPIWRETWNGVLRRLKWTSEKPQWDVIWVGPHDRCDRYANCGAYGYCDSNRVAECGCLKGFEPKMPRDWNLRNWSDGCVRHTPLDCAGQGDGFFKFERVKLPDTSRSRGKPTWSLNECKECLKNCSCTAYASASVSGEGGGCVLWYGNLTDVKVYSDQGQDLYTRVAASELGK